MKSDIERLVEDAIKQNEKQCSENFKDLCKKYTRAEVKERILQVANLIMDDPIKSMQLAEALLNSGQFDDVFKKEGAI